MTLSLIVKSLLWLALAMIVVVCVEQLVGWVLARRQARREAQAQRLARLHECVTLVESIRSQLKLRKP